jgi:hypothetical protein
MGVEHGMLEERATWKARLMLRGVSWIILLFLVHQLYKLISPMVVLIAVEADQPLLRQITRGEVVRITGTPRDSGLIDGTNDAGETLTFFYTDLLERSVRIDASSFRSSGIHTGEPPDHA